MLGHHWPGSEGNLASDLENQDQSLDTGNQAQPPTKAEGAKESRARAPRGEKSAAPPPPPVETKPPAEAETENNQTNPSEAAEAQTPGDQTNPAETAAKPEMTGRLFDP